MRPSCWTSRARSSRGGVPVRGVLTHAGSSYDCRSLEAIRAMAEQERAAVVHAAEPPARGRQRLPGGQRRLHADRALRRAPRRRDRGARRRLRVLRPGDGRHRRLQRRRHRPLGADHGDRPPAREGLDARSTPAGWRCRATAAPPAQPVDQGYGLVCDLDGRPLHDLILVGANQEHGIMAHRPGAAPDALRPAGRHAGCASCPTTPAPPPPSTTRYQVVRGRLRGAGDAGSASAAGRPRRPRWHRG